MKELLKRIEKARFLTTDELYENKEIIREEVQTYDYDTLELYKYYFFFQLSLLKNPLKEKLWNYLVKERLGINEEAELALEYRLYKERCKRILQNQKKKDEEMGLTNEDIYVVKKQTITINSVEDLFKI